MNMWLIVAIIICLFIYVLYFNVEYDEYKKAKQKGYQWNITWRKILILAIAPLYFICGIIYFLFIYLIWSYISKIREHGGFKGYREWKRQEKKDQEKRDADFKAWKEEQKRLTNAYKNGELKREELPRYLKEERDIELYGDIFGDRWQDLIYIENEYNEQLNNFFKSHPVIKLKHNIRVVYLPSHIQELMDNDIIKYLYPSIDNINVPTPIINTKDVLLKELCYPEDIQKLNHGFISCSGWIYNCGINSLHGRYYPLEISEESDLLLQIENIAKEAYRYNTGGLYSTISRPPTDKKPTNDFADEQFSWEVYDLLDEVRERIEKLQQIGISKKLLIKYIMGEPKLSRLVITKDMRIILPDYQNMEIEMEPINKAVYLLFLRHPEGIIFKYLPDYRKELAEIYQMIKPFGLNERALRSIEDVTNPCLNSINEKCARIRSAFVSKFDESLAEKYYINGWRGKPKKIALPRDLVTWEK